MHFLAFIIIAVSVCSCLPNRIDAQKKRYTVRAHVGSKTEIGWPIVQDSKNLVMLRRDGSIKYVSLANIQKIEKISEQFAPYTFDKFVRRLGEIHGRAYQVTPTRHFVIVHPKGQGKRWVKLFEQTYAQFVAYFSSLGIRMKSPEFPLMAIVFNKRSEFDAYTSKRGFRAQRSIVGVYMLVNNRILTYDRSISSGANSEANRRTIIHEITHQLAFNTGVQNRFAPPPVWVGEGIAVMFEAPGIRERHRYRQYKDRVHAAYLQNAKKLLAEKKFVDVLKKLIVSDQVFKTEQTNAYTVSWALTYFLSQTKPEAFSRYLKKTATRSSFSKYTDRQRWADFANHFGNDLNGIAAAINQHFERKR